MRLLDYSFDLPEENLAFDEVLLDGVESGRSDAALRFWESPVYFVVLGVSQKLAEEVREDVCNADAVPVLRRCSAGGCVLQGPGSLNFSLVLSYEDIPEIRTISSSYSFILGSLAEAFQARGFMIKRGGKSDLTLDGLKVSGNAQKRRKNAILHHGTLLYDEGHKPQLTHDLMRKYLREPADRPDYRGIRTHEEFVGYVPMSADRLREIVTGVFHKDGISAITDDVPSECELLAIKTLVSEKYSCDEWTRRR